MPPCLYASLAQLVEHATVNRVVTGSSPVGGATQSRAVGSSSGS